MRVIAPMTSLGSIETLFPSSVSFAAVKTSSAPMILPLAEEEKLCADWRSEARRELFRAGRTAVHEALQGLGLDRGTPVLRGPQGEPVWPEGAAVSISNTTGMAVAAACCIPQFRSIGVDIELRRRPVRLELKHHLCLPSEFERLHSCGMSLLLLFSAKEALYKALYPICRRLIGFKEMELRWDAGDEAWRVVPQVEIPLELNWDRLRVRWREMDEYIVSGIAITADASG